MFQRMETIHTIRMMMQISLITIFIAHCLQVNTLLRNEISPIARLRQTQNGGQAIAVGERMGKLKHPLTGAEK